MTAAVVLVAMLSMTTSFFSEEGTTILDAYEINPGLTDGQEMALSSFLVLSGFNVSFG